MTPTDTASFLAAAASGHEIRITIGEAMIFGAPVAVVGGGVTFAPRGGGPPQSYDSDSIAGVVVLASRVPRPQQRRGTR